MYHIFSKIILEKGMIYIVNQKSSLSMKLKCPGFEISSLKCLIYA